MSRRREVAADTRAPGTRLAHVLEVGLQARMQAARLTPFQIPREHAVDMKRGTEETVFVPRSVVKQVEPGWPGSFWPRDANVGTHTHSTRLWMFELGTKRDDEKTYKTCFTYRNMSPIASWFRQLMEETGERAIPVADLAFWTEKYGVEPFYLPKGTWLSKENKLRLSMHFVTKSGPYSFGTYQFTKERFDGLTAPFTNRGATPEEPKLYITSLQDFDVELFRETFAGEELWQALQGVQTHRESEPLEKPDESKKQKTVDSSTRSPDSDAAVYR